MALKGKSGKKNKLIMWTPPVKKMLYALSPLVALSIYQYGWRSLLLFLVINSVGFLTEYFYVRVYKQKVSSAVFCTTFLFTLILPPTIPYWMAIVGIIFAVLFGKMVFGGFGKNVFNPALVGRAFLYISFGLFMTGKKAWLEPLFGGAGGLLNYSVDAVSAATPMKLLAAGKTVDLFSLFIGNTAGCLGESSALLIILGGLYLTFKKVASYRIVIATILGAIIMQGALWLANVPGSYNPLFALLSGGFLFGTFFMATDPVSAAQTNEGRWIFGLLVGVLTVLIRTFSAWPEGMMFAILLGNMFAPIIDYAIKEYKAQKKLKLTAAKN